MYRYGMSSLVGRRECLITHSSTYKTAYVGRRECLITHSTYKTAYVGRRECLITHSSTYKTAYSDSCKTHTVIPVYTAVFLKMNPWVRNK